MRYIRFYGGTGYCGCDFEEYRCINDNYPDCYLDDDAKALAYENAETYEHVATGGEGWESEEEQESYYADAYCFWEEISREEYKENT